MIFNARLGLWIVAVSTFSATSSPSVAQSHYYLICKGEEQALVNFISNGKKDPFELVLTVDIPDHTLAIGDVRKLRAQISRDRIEAREGSGKDYASRSITINRRNGDYIDHIIFHLKGSSLERVGICEKTTINPIENKS